MLICLQEMIYYLEWHYLLNSKHTRGRAFCFTALKWPGLSYLNLDKLITAGDRMATRQYLLPVLHRLPFLWLFLATEAGSYGAYDSPRFFQVKRSNWELALEESWTGSVYVLERSGFEAHTAFGGVQTSKAPIRPVDVIGVTVEHVPIDDVEVWEPSPEQLEMWAKAKQTPMSGM
jgi:hypothetical protein